MQNAKRAMLPELEFNVAPAGGGQETKILAAIWWIGCIILA